jgi:glycosidase
MQWTDEDNSPSWKEGWESVSPDYLSYNVVDEINDPDSILAHYRSMIDVRTQHPSLRVGDLNIISPSSSGLLSFLRNSTQESILVIINLTDEPVADYQLSLKESSLAAGTYTAVSLLSEAVLEDLVVESDGSFNGYRPCQQIPPYSTLVIALTQP